MKIDIKKAISILACVAAGISAIVAESNSQKQERTVADLVDRVSQLEKRES